jgi:predicted SAM-dependent methyltransferase
MTMAFGPDVVGALMRQSERITRHLLPSARIDREAIAKQYVRGKGIEIGALHHPLKVPRTATVTYVDRLSVEGLREHYPELKHEKLVPVDIIDDGEQLTRLARSSQDFVIANHFIEHCQDPIGAIQNMLRVLAPGGVLYLAIPDKRYTFDEARPLTSLEHLLQDFDQGPEWSRKQHFEEWVRLVNKIEDDAQFERRVDELMARDYSIHYHVWTQMEILELLMTLAKKMSFGFEIELCTRGGIEVVMILRKT